MLSSIQYNDSRVSYDYYPNSMLKRVSKDDNTVADYRYEKGSVKEIEYANGSNILYNYKCEYIRIEY